MRSSVIGLLWACVCLALVSPAWGQDPLPPLYSAAVHIDGVMSGTAANGVFFDGQNIWVMLQDHNGGSVAKLSSSGAVLSTTRVGSVPIEAAYDGSRIWFTNYVSSTISILDRSGQILNTIQLPSGSDPEGILFDGKYMWVANNGPVANYVSKFDPVTTRLIAKYPVGINPDWFAFDGTYIWVTNSNSNNVMKLNRETGAILRTYPTGLFPLSMVFDGTSIWIGNGAPSSRVEPTLATRGVTRLRAYGGVNLGDYATGYGARGMVYDGQYLWVCNSYDNTVTRLRTSDGVSFGTYPTGIGPRGIAFDGKKFWIANSGESTLTLLAADAADLRPASGTLVSPVGGAFTADTLSSSHARRATVLGGILTQLLDDN
ncbi:MAG: YncE family protein [Proteobacteria bacterium]|nr:YncE family protein [Pseudomonadota bacterium]